MNFTALRLATAFLLVLSMTGCQSDAPPNASKAKTVGGPVRVYVGTYTGAKSKGIYVMDIDPASGTLTEPKLAAETRSPSFLAIHPNRRFLYAVGEIDTFLGEKTGSVSAFEIGAGDGMLKALNHQPSGGAGPCHVDVDPTGASVLVANYGSGSVALLPTESDGSLKPAASVVQHQGGSVDKQRQQGPHAHCITVAPRRSASGKHTTGRALVADLGLDKILAYDFEPGGALKPANPPSAPAAPGAGPRHLAFGGSGRFVYVNNEMASTVTAYSYDPSTGAMKDLQTLSTLPDNFDKSKNSTAEIAVHPTGKFVYVSNRGHDSIAGFNVDEKTGKLTASGHQSTGGKTPRSFGIDPSGRFLLAANQNSDTVVVFRIDPKSGALTPTGATASVPSPVCVVFVTP